MNFSITFRTRRHYLVEKQFLCLIALLPLSARGCITREDVGEDKIWRYRDSNWRFMKLRSRSHSQSWMAPSICVTPTIVDGSVLLTNWGTWFSTSRMSSMTDCLKRCHHLLSQVAIFESRNSKANYCFVRQITVSCPSLRLYLS